MTDKALYSQQDGAIATIIYSTIPFGGNIDSAQVKKNNYNNKIKKVQICVMPFLFFVYIFYYYYCTLGVCYKWYNHSSLFRRSRSWLIFIKSITTT